MLSMLTSVGPWPVLNIPRSLAQNRRSWATKRPKSARDSSIICNDSLTQSARAFASTNPSLILDLTEKEMGVLSNPWRLPKASSASTFVENNRALEALFQYQQVRGFKSRRYTDQGAMPFRKSAGDKSESSSDGGGTNPWDFDPAKILERTKYPLKEAANYKTLAEALNSKQLTGPDAKLAAASIHGFAAGLKTGQGSDGANSHHKTFKISRLVIFGFQLGLVALLAAVFMGLINVNFRINKNVIHEFSPEDINVTFSDVKGCDEAKDELKDLVEFLKNSDKFEKLGGKQPKGCLLVGPPGTGKTLLAKAVAGEAGVPFFHASGSEFDEMFVGQGARRIRDLFSMAKSKAPCVIFIDEIDSVGGKRTSSPNHPYANQTINQLLSEMDGFVSSEGVIVLAATNMVNQLDKALLRPGRFDTRVQVPKPDMKGRKDILVLYLAKIIHDSSVDVDKLAKMTVGFSGADLENLVNTAAIKAALMGLDAVTMAELEYSHDKHVLGTDWRSRQRHKDDLKVTAYHEAGHTLVAYYTKHSHPLHKVTIIAKGDSGGHTAFIPERDATMQTKAQILANMDVSMGGRAAEEIIFGKEQVTTGASSDLQSATMHAEYMIKKAGMSQKVGLRVVPDNDGLPIEISPHSAAVIDQEVNDYLNNSYSRAMNLLVKHRKELEALAEALLQYETLDVDDIKAIIEGNESFVRKKLSASAIQNISKGSSSGPKIEGGHHTAPKRPGEILVHCRKT